MDAGLAVDFLARGMRLTHVPGYTLSRHPIDPLPWGVIGYQRQIDQTRLKIDAQPDLQSLISLLPLTLISGNDDHPAQPHGIVPHSNAGHAGGNPID